MIRSPLFKLYIVESKILNLNISTSVSKYLEYSMSPVLFSFTNQTFIEWLNLCNCQGHFVQTNELEFYFLVSSSFDGVLISSFQAWRGSSQLCTFCGFRPVSFRLVSQNFLASLLCLQSGDEFHEQTPVLEQEFLNRLLFTFRYRL